jgi:gamma-glutamyltranspeptidase/glutathione hydrolase
MVSLIQSNYRGMGSGMVPPKLGLCYKIEELFDLEEGKPNSLRKKRPFIPAFVTKDQNPL